MKRGEWLALAVTAILAVTGGWVILATTGHHHARPAARLSVVPPSSTAPSTSAAPTTTTSPPSTVAASGYDVAKPVAPPSTTAAPTPTSCDAPCRLIIPSIGVNAPVVPTGSEGPNGGSLVIPSDIQVVGWWDGNWQSPTGVIQEAVPQPGQPGVAVLAGHVDSAAAGEGALYRLADTKPGDPITVIGQNGTTSWTVSQPPQIVLKSALPSSLWVNSGPPRLAVVTCGGPFDASTGHYEDNVIVWASPAS